MPYTISSCVYAQIWTAYNPLFGSDIISKSAITQSKTCLAITPTPTFILILLETLCTYTCEDTVYVYRIHSNRWLCPNRHSPPSSSSSWYTKMGEIDDLCIKNAWAYDKLALYLQLLCPLVMYLKSNFGPIIMNHIDVLLTLGVLLLERIRYAALIPIIVLQGIY